VCAPRSPVDYLLATTRLYFETPRRSWEARFPAIPSLTTLDAKKVVKSTPRSRQLFIGISKFRGKLVCLTVVYELLFS
jgi:hypothetical protein